MWTICGKVNKSHKWLEAASAFEEQNPASVFTEYAYDEVLSSLACPLTWKTGLFSGLKFGSPNTKKLVLKTSYPCTFQNAARLKPATESSHLDWAQTAVSQAKKSKLPATGAPCMSEVIKPLARLALWGQLNGTICFELSS